MSLARFRWFHRLAAWLIGRAEQRGTPDFIVYNATGEYLRRWWLIPRNPLLNVYLHNIVGPDDDRALHCHPWINCSVILRGFYTEVLPLSQSQHPRLDYEPGYTTTRIRTAGDLVPRLGHTRHRLVAHAGNDCWTLFLTGPLYRALVAIRWRTTWGFHCARGFVPWRQFVDARDKGRAGAGCGG